MLSAGHYVAPPPGTILPSVEEFAKDSSYFQDFATIESTEDMVSALDNFLHNRGPSFGPDYAPKNRSSTGGHHHGGNVTPSMTRTVDLKVFQRGSRHGPSTTTMTPAIQEEDDDDASDGGDNVEDHDDDHAEYDDDDDEFEDDDSEDEPFVGADGSSLHHPSSSYSVSSIVKDAKKEQEKEMLLAQAFAYVTRVERVSQREEQLEARRARRSNGKSKKSSGGSSNRSKLKQQQQQRSRGGVQSRKKKKNQTSQQRQQQQQDKPLESAIATERPTQLGAARDRAQSRLYGAKKRM
jgi:hypothetical protein